MTTDIIPVPNSTSNSDDLSDQRVGNDVELRELVYQSLECDGIIARLKAELRAAVFKTIEKATNSIPTNSHTPSYDGTTGRICRALVLDWLKHSHLLYTEDVFKVETTGPNHPAPLTHTELLEQLHIKSNQSQPILHALINHRANPSISAITSLPHHIEQSIDNQFPNEKINNLNSLRDHFRSLFSSAFDPSVLDVYVNKHIPSTLTSLSKHDYEEICLKWIQACANVLAPQSNSIKQASSLVPAQLKAAQNAVSNSQITSHTGRPTSPSTDSSSTSSSSSSGENNRKTAFDFPLPTTMNSNKSVITKATDIIPPPLINFDDNDSNDDEDDEDRSASVFSTRNATPAALNHLKNIDNIIQGDETPCTRTIIKKTTNNGTKDLPIEYDDESMSQSVSHSIISSVDDITVDKGSTASANIDFLEDF